MLWTCVRDCFFDWSLTYNHHPCHTRLCVRSFCFGFVSFSNYDVECRTRGFQRDSCEFADQIIVIFIISSSSIIIFAIMGDLWWGWSNASISITIHTNMHTYIFSTPLQLYCPLSIPLIKTTINIPLTNPLINSDFLESIDFHSHRCIGHPCCVQSTQMMSSTDAELAQAQRMKAWLIEGGGWVNLAHLLSYNLYD